MTLIATSATAHNGVGSASTFTETLELTFKREGMIRRESLSVHITSASRLVQSLVRVSEDANVLNVVKAKHGLRTKSLALDLVARAYAKKLLEPDLRPEYVERLKAIEKQRSVLVRSLSKRYDFR